MNKEIKDVALALLSGRQYVYALLHTLLGAEPTPELVAAATGTEAMAALAMLEGEESSAPRLLCEALKLMREADMNALKSEYTDLLLGTGDMIAAPWESVYTTKERALFQESTLDVRVWFRRFGYVAGGYPNFPDDHISLMMDFIARTTVMAAEELTGGNVKGCAAILEDQMAFQKAHMLNWLKAFAKDMQMGKTSVFYPALSVAVAEFVAYDHQVLAEMRSELEV